MALKFKRAASANQFDYCIVFIYTGKII